MMKSIYSKITPPSGLILFCSLFLSGLLTIACAFLYIELVNNEVLLSHSVVLAGTTLFLSIIVVLLILLLAINALKLKGITASIGQYSPGQSDFSFTEKLSGESGIIARTFEAMALDLEHCQNQLHESDTQLQECKSQFRALSDCGEIGLWNYSFKGKTLYANPAMLKFTQAEDISQLENHSIYNFFSPKDKGCLAKFNQIVEGGVPVSFEIEMTGLSKKRRYLLVSSSPVILGNGKIQSIISAFVDISDRKRAEIQLRESRDTLEKYSQRLELANVELETFSYSVSHDLKAPLMHIDGYANLLLNEKNSHLNEQEKHYIDRIVSNSEYMQKMIKGILDLSRANTALLNKEKVNLSNLAKLVFLDFRKQHPDVPFEFKIDKNVIATCDYYLMRTVLENLIGNSLKYSSECEPIQVDFGVSSQNEDSITLMVRDNGIGFDSEKKEKLFLPFQRLHNTKKYPGTGVGLTSVKRIIERHGGAVSAESEENKGATFFFTLQK